MKKPNSSSVPAKDLRLAGSLPPKPRKPRRDGRRSDIVIAGLGVTLGLVCALFPWYIFFNQEKFGVRAMRFDGNGDALPPAELAYQPQLIGAPMSTGDIPQMDLDFLPTGTSPDPSDPRRTAPVAEQPFPADLIGYELVHVVNGRAMIADEAGLWVVQPGSQLPDASHVRSIERRDGKWVLVTTSDRVVKMRN